MTPLQSETLKSRSRGWGFVLVALVYTSTGIIAPDLELWLIFAYLALAVCAFGAINEFFSFQTFLLTQYPWPDRRKEFERVLGKPEVHPNLRRS